MCCSSSITCINTIWRLKRLHMNTICNIWCNKNTKLSIPINIRRLDVSSYKLQNGIQNTGVELPFSLCGKELYFCVTFAFRCSRRRLGNCTLRNQTENSLCIQWLGWKKKDYRRAFTCISSSRKGVHS